MPFTEKANTIVFSDKNNVPFVKIMFDDGTTQVWEWWSDRGDWFRNDKRGSN